MADGSPVLTVEQSLPEGLSYCNDHLPGLRRRRAGKGFAYVDQATGASVRDRAVLDRARALGIPPAWTDVWICADPRGHIQATGRDQKGRKQYRYHDDWSRHRSDGKFERMADFARACRNSGVGSRRTWPCVVPCATRCWPPRSACWS